MFAHAKLARLIAHDANTANSHRGAYSLLQCPGADLSFDGALGKLAGPDGGGATLSEAAAARLQAATAAISAGIMESSLDEATACT
jgi:hypothetical protein